MRKLLFALSLIICISLSACSEPVPDTPVTPDTPADTETNIFANAQYYTDVKGKHHTVYINEVCTSNRTAHKTRTDLSCDYIELYNSKLMSTSIEGFTITDKSDGTNLFTFPKVTVPGDGHLLIYASGVTLPIDNAVHLPFKLSSVAGETLYLLDREGLIIDTIEIPALETDTVYARTVDGGDTFAIMTPTPENKNKRGELVELTEKVVVPAPTLSVSSGFYNGGDVSITAEAGLKIYYTLDCSVPTTDSTEYTGAFVLDPDFIPDDGYDGRKEALDKASWESVEKKYQEELKTNPNAVRQPYVEPDRVITLRAAAFDANGNSSDVVSVTLLTDDQKGSGYNNMGILSVIIDPFDLYDYETGLFVSGKIYDDYVESGGFMDKEWWLIPQNMLMSGYEWERDAHLDFFEVGGELALSQEIGVRNHGNSSRGADLCPLRFYAREEYDGNNAFTYDIFGNGKATDVFIVRNGNSERGQTKIRDVFAQQLAVDAGCDVDTQDTRPCVLFVNGEYWGVYNMQERFDDEYFESTYGIPSENVAMVKPLTYKYSEGNKATAGGTVALKLYDELLAFMTQTDFSVDENYDKLCEMVDIENMIDFFSVQFLAGNVDYTSKNIALWRTFVEGTHENEDTKWRWILFDLDMSQWARNNCYPERDFLEVACWLPYFNNIYNTSETFREAFKARVSELCEYYFAPDYTLEKLKEYREVFGDAMAHFFEQLPMSVHRAPGDRNYTGAPIPGAEEYDYVMKQLEDYWAKRKDAALKTLGIE